MVTLANNIKGLKSSVNTTNFVKGLISGSGKLVNNSNSKTVLGSLTKLAGMDLSSLQASAKTAASTAAKSAATEAITKIASSKTGANAVSNAKEIASAASTLSTLFKTLKK